MKTLAFDLHGTLAHVSDDSTLIADIELLTKLKKKYSLALITGCTRQEATKALQQTGLDVLFDADMIVLCEESGGEKDTGKPFEEIRRRVLGPVVMIGDRPSDLSGSALAGIPCIIVESKENLTDQKSALLQAIDTAVQLLETQ